MNDRELYLATMDYQTGGPALRHRAEQGYPRVSLAFALLFLSCSASAVEPSFLRQSEFNAAAAELRGLDGEKERPAYNAGRNFLRWRQREALMPSGLLGPVTLQIHAPQEEGK